MSRRKNDNDYFARLLYGIYGRINLKIHYKSSNGSTSQKTSIMFAGNEYSKLTYTHIKQENYKHIFYLTFCEPEIDFVNDKEEIVFERADAVSNAIDYLMKFDVEIPEYFREKSENKILCKGIYTAIADIILPVIFECQNSKKELDKRFDSIKIKLQSHFTGFELGYLEGIKGVANDYEIIYDSEFYNLNKEEQFDDSYAITIDSEKFVVNIIIHCKIEAINIGKKNNDDMDIYSIESIIGNYQKYPFADDEPFISPFAWQAENYAANGLIYTEDSYFPLSSCSIPTQYFIPKYFYYVTRINESIINKYNDEIKDKLRMPLILTDGSANFPSEEDVNREFEFKRLDHAKLDNLLIKRAVNDFRLKHKNDISEYYRHVMTYIEDMIRRIATADYSYAIRRDSDVEACQKFAKHFNIDYEKIIKFIEDDDCVQRVYDEIENAIFEFAMDLERLNNTFAATKIVDEFEEFLPYNIESHYNSIGEYLDSGNLTKAIKLERERAGNTYEQIYNALREYHDTLGKTINRER